MEKALSAGEGTAETIESGIYGCLVGESSEYVHLTSQAMIIEKEFVTDEGKLWFLRKHVWKMEDVHPLIASAFST